MQGFVLAAELDKGRRCGGTIGRGMEKRRDKTTMAATQDQAGLPRQLGAMLAAVRMKIRTGDSLVNGDAPEAGPASLHRASLVHHDRQLPVPAAWSLEALRSLEWKRFGQLCAGYYEAAGFRTEALETKADGTSGLRLFKTDSSLPLAIVQCHGWSTGEVGVPEIRALLEAMAQARCVRGILAASGVFSAEARVFAAAHPVQLLDGAAIDAKIRALAPALQDALRASAFKGDYRTPTCPSCGARLRSRVGKRASFWGCKNYPQCKTLIQVPGPAPQRTPAAGG